MSMFRPFYGGEKGGTKSQQDKHIVPTSSEERKLLLNQLKCRLSDTPHELKAAYAHAQRVNSKIVDDDHLLLFLEYDNFDVEVRILPRLVTCRLRLVHVTGVIVN